MVPSDVNLNDWRLSRYRVKQARLRLVKEGDVVAAEQLLCHSIAYGHSSLIIQRYLIARSLGLSHVALYYAYYKKAKREMNEDRLKKAKSAADRTMRSIRKMPGSVSVLMSRG